MGDVKAVTRQHGGQGLEEDTETARHTRARIYIANAGTFR
jgi:hypothetical protein